MSHEFYSCGMIWFYAKPRVMMVCRARISLGGRLNWLMAFSLILGSQLLWADAIPPHVDLPEVRKSPAGKRFIEVPSGDSGVDFRNSWKAPRDYERALTLSFGAGGVAVGDYDDDGRPDLYLTRPFGGGQLYRNLGDFTFEDVTVKCGLGGEEFWQASPSFADIDGDGDLDLYVCAFDATNRLYLNEKGVFKECAKEAGLN